MRKIDPEKKKKAKKIAKGLLIFGAGATIAVGGLAVAAKIDSMKTMAFGHGYDQAKKDLADFNYCHIKHDITDKFIDMAVKDSNTVNCIPKIGNRSNGKETFAHIVGQPNELEFIKRLCKDSAVKEQIKLIATAENLADVKTF